MTKHYCDRCKREIEGEWVYKLTRENQTYAYKTVKEAHLDYELCDKCSGEVDKWLEGEEVDVGLEEKIKRQAQEMLIKNFNEWVRE